MIGELILLCLVGIVAIIFLILSADYVVRKLVIIAHHFGVSDTFIGLTVVSIGTSLPEISSHVIASIGILNKSLEYEIASATVVGANIGSDIVQQTLILGIVVLLFGTLAFSKKFLYVSYTLMTVTTILCLILGLDQEYSRLDGLLLFGIFLAYMLYLYKTENLAQVTQKEKANGIWKNIFFATGGFIVLLLSSTVILHVVEYIVNITQIGGSIIGALALGVASALPELFTAIQGVKNKAKGISIGTLIGSNITNPLMGIGFGALISQYYVPLPIILWDLPIKTITAVLLFIFVIHNRRRLGRKTALFLIASYFVYVIIRMLYFSVD